MYFPFFTGFSPGPWAKCSDSTLITDAESKIVTTVAECPATEETERANANLIAAAPELHNAVYALHWLATEDPAKINDDRRVEILEQAAAALHKANGTKPRVKS